MRIVSKNMALCTTAICTRGILLNYQKNQRDCFKILSKISTWGTGWILQSNKYNSFLVESMNLIKNTTTSTGCQQSQLVYVPVIVFICRAQTSEQNQSNAEGDEIDV